MLLKSAILPLGGSKMPWQAASNRCHKPSRPGNRWNNAGCLAYPPVRS
jgi:hypothetical protein